MIGKNVYEIRKKRGYTLSELAENAQISKSYLSNIERNINKNPSINVIEKIANVLKVDLKTLLGIESFEDPNKHPESEWVDFVNELKDSGMKKEQIKNYRTLIEFINWKNQNSVDS